MERTKERTKKSDGYKYYRKKSLSYGYGPSKMRKEKGKFYRNEKKRRGGGYRIIKGRFAIKRNFLFIHYYDVIYLKF